MCPMMLPWHRHPQCVSHSSSTSLLCDFNYIIKNRPTRVVNIFNIFMNILFFYFHILHVWVNVQCSPERTTWVRPVHYIVTQFFATCRWVQYTADHDCSPRHQVSSEQQINSRLFAYVYCYRAESRRRVRGQMYGAEITLHCCPAFTFTDSATKRFYPLICPELKRQEALTWLEEVEFMLSSVRLIIWYHLGLFCSPAEYGTCWNFSEGLQWFLRLILTINQFLSEDSWKRFMQKLDSLGEIYTTASVFSLLTAQWGNVFVQSGVRSDGDVNHLLYFLTNV